MIRAFTSQDIESVMELWLDTNILAHSFIEREYWYRCYDAVKAMLPNATIYIYEENHVIQGFVGLMDDYLAGIFVSAQFQSKGIGKKLLDCVKRQKCFLTLNVYKENARALNFYLREGFTLFKEQIDESTGKVEFIMRWENARRPRQA